MPAGTSYTFKKGMLSPVIKTADLFGKQMCVLQVKNQFLHATHPLAWIRKIEIEVDGKRIPEDTIYFSVRNQWFQMITLHTVEDVFWFITEQANICFPRVYLDEKNVHQVTCTFVLSMLEDPQTPDRKEIWPKRIESVEGMLTMEETHYEQ